MFNRGFLAFTIFLKIKYDDAVYVWENTVKKYFGVDDITDIENKCKVIGMTRVLRRTLKREPENTELVNKSKEILINALDAIDSLEWRK